MSTWHINLSSTGSFNHSRIKKAEASDSSTKQTKKVTRQVTLKTTLMTKACKIQLILYLTWKPFENFYFNIKKSLSSEETTDSANQPRSSLRIKSNTCNSIIDDKSAKQFKSVCLVPRPWRYIDGLLNRPVLQKMLETVIIHLKTYPNSSLENIANHFCPVLQPIMTLELLEILEELRVVVKTVLRKEEDCTLFSDFQNGAIKLDDLDLARGDEIYTYCCTQNAIFTIKTLFAK